MITGCAKCAASALTDCSQCATGKYLESGTTTALPKCHDSVPIGFGPLTANTFILGRCLKTRCSLCPTDVNVCTGCAEGSYLKDGECLIPPADQGKGFDPVSKTYTICKDTNCIECRGNIEVCKLCNVDSVLEPKSGKCYKLGDWNTFPDRTGVEGYYLKTCAAASCKRCPTGINMCEECFEGFLLDFFGEIATCENSSGNIDAGLL